VKRLTLLKFNGERWSSVAGAIMGPGHAPGRFRNEMTTTFSNKIETWAAVACIVVGLAGSGCSRTTSGAEPKRGPDVEVVPVEQRDIPVYREWIGVLDGMVNAAIRAQVTGYLVRQTYSEGSFVKKGQLLFEIDARPFQAAVEQAKGQLAEANGRVAQAKAQLIEAQARLVSAESNQRKAQLDVDRYIPLAQQQAVSQQDLDNATQNNLSGKAQVEGARAGIETAKAQIQVSSAAVEAAQAILETAQLNLGFTRLTSPIDGIAGVAQIQIGNLVGPATGAVTTVSTVDPIKADFTMSEQEYLKFARRETAMNRLQFEMILADGTVYPRRGKFFFADRNVDLGTGAIRLQGLFDNPGNILRPGQYARVRAVTEIRAGALLIPQRAVTELQGGYSVAVVAADNRISVRPVRVGVRDGPMWVIEEGLKAGELVVAEGTQRVRPDMAVNPKPFVALSPTGIRRTQP